jgi:hypothetical protein
MVQEVTVHRMRRTDRVTAVQQGTLAGRACTLHPFDERVLERALGLIAHSSIRGRDAVHAATADTAGLDVIVTTASNFDAVMKRIDPAQLVAGARWVALPRKGSRSTTVAARALPSHHEIRHAVRSRHHLPGSGCG